MSAWKDDEEEVPPSKIALKNGKCTGFHDLCVVCENRMLGASLNGCGVWNFLFYIACTSFWCFSKLNDGVQVHLD